MAGDDNELVPRLNAATWARMRIAWAKFRQRLEVAERHVQGAAPLLAADNVFNEALIKQFLDFERATGERLTVRIRAVNGQ